MVAQGGDVSNHAIRLKMTVTEPGGTVTRKTIHEYVQGLRPRYLAAGRQGKRTILEEFCATTGYHPKSAIRLFRREATHPKGRRGRQRTYGRELGEPLKKLWEAADCICAERLAPFLPDLLASLEQHGEIRLEAATRQLLLQMSASTMDRLLAAFRKPSHKRHGLTQSQFASVTLILTQESHAR